MKTFWFVLVFIIPWTLAAQPETTLTGKVLGHDGKPMLQTDIHVYKGSGQRPTTTSHASSDGSYTLTFRDSGIVTVKFAGLFHLSEDIPLLIEQPGTIRLNVYLGTYRFAKDPKQITIMGGFNNWNMQSAAPMKKETDGTFTASFETKDATFGYQVIGAEAGGRSTNGTQFKTHEYDGDGDYRSFVIPKDGKVSIVFEPARVLTSNAQPHIEFDDSTSRCARYAMIKWEAGLRSREMSESYRAFVDQGGDPVQFKYSKDRSQELTKYAAQIKVENDPLIRQALFAAYLGMSGDNGDPEIGRMFLKEGLQKLKDAPLSKVFELLSPYLSAGRLMKYNAEFMASYEELLQSAVDKNFSGNLAMNVLSSLQSEKGDSIFANYYDATIRNMRGSPWEQTIKRSYAPKKALDAGNRVPSFSVVSIDDPGTTYSNGTFRGKVYLLHFWATWNGPSVRDMEMMHKVYEKFKSKDFEILSLSLDAKPEQVKKFRDTKWKMPWLHAFVTTDKKVMGDFGAVASTLKPLLIDGTGTIIAVQDQLVGDRLEKTLNTVFKVSD